PAIQSHSRPDPRLQERSPARCRNPCLCERLALAGPATWSPRDVSSTMLAEAGRRSAYPDPEIGQGRTGHMNNAHARLTLALAAGTTLSPLAAPAQEGAADHEEVLTTSGDEQLISQAPASISTLTRAAPEERPSTSLEDAVRNAEGVSVDGGGPISTDI